MTASLRMGTRASALARTQSGLVAESITRATGIAVETVIIRTEGDRLSTEGKAPPGGDVTGVFTRALDDALREGRIDFAVHSLKDVPTGVDAGLLLAAVPPREDPRDAFVVASRHAGVHSLRALPPRATVATSSPRRIAQLLRLRPDLKIVEMTGNVDTRLKKLENGDADALILACSGLDRLGLSSVIRLRLAPEELLPAPAQGALAVVCRSSDSGTIEALATQDDRVSRATAEAERSLLNHLRGGCRAPVGASAVAGGLDGLELVGRVLSLDGREAIEVVSHGAVSDAVDLGRRVAEDLLSRGAARLIQDARA